MIVLITGPLRSGKSARAAHVARSFGRSPTYVATARVDPSDLEMLDRIARHRADRGDMLALELWRPGTPDLPALIASAKPHTTLLVDSLGTWIAGHLLDLEQMAARDPVAALHALAERTDPLVDAVRGARADLVFVSEETGWGLVAPFALGRIFSDVLGRLVARVAQQADRVELVVAGYALDIKACGVPVSA